jgi:holin-like protein LrgB
MGGGGDLLAQWCICSCFREKDDGTPLYRSRKHVLRLLNARTFANYLKLGLWVGVLIIFDQIIHLSSNSTVTAMSPIIMFGTIFLVLEASQRVHPTFYERFKRFTSPGNLFLNQWIALMFFVFTVSLPYALRNISAVTIVGWAAAIVIGTVIQSIGTAYFVVGWTLCFPEAKDDELALVNEAALADHVEMPHHATAGEGQSNEAQANGDGGSEDRTSDIKTLGKGIRGLIKFQEMQAEDMERSSRRRAESQVRGSLMDTAKRFMDDVAVKPTPYDDVRETRVTEAFFDEQALKFFDPLHGHFFQSTSQLHAADARATAIMSLLKDELHNGYTNLAQHLTSILEADFAEDETVLQFLTLEHQEFDAELTDGGGGGGDKIVQKEIEPEWVKVKVLSHFDVVVVFSFIAIASAILHVFDSQSPKPYIFAFQFASTIVVHVSMTVYRTQLLGWLPPKLLAVLQPALLVIALLILIAGGTWPGGFMQGLDKYRLRQILPDGKDTIFHGKWWRRGLGPGEVIGILLNPAIATLAFPTSAAMSTLSKKIPVIVMGSFWSAILSFFTMAFLGFLLVNDEAVSLSLLPHSVSTAVAIGFSSILCEDGICAVSSIIATTCIVTGVIQMIFGPTLLSFCRVNDPIARGIAIGSSGMALGVAGLKKSGEVEAAGAAAMAYAVFAVVSAVLVLIPGVVEVLSSIGTAEV